MWVRAFTIFSQKKSTSQKRSNKAYKRFIIWFDIKKKMLKNTFPWRLPPFIVCFFHVWILLGKIFFRPSEGVSALVHRHRWRRSLQSLIKVALIFKNSSRFLRTQNFIKLLNMNLILTAGAQRREKWDPFGDRKKFPQSENNEEGLPIPFYISRLSVN